MKSYFDREEWYREFLTADEQVKWTGKAERIFAFYPIYLFLIPFMCVWCGGVIYGTVTQLIDLTHGEGNLFFLLFLTPFWAGGAFFVYVIFIMPVRRRKYTRYAVTNRRVMEYYRGSFNAVFIGSFTPVRLSETSRRGTGTITVGYRSDSDNAGASIRMPWQYSGAIEITDVAEPHMVYNLIVTQDGT